MIFGGGAVFPSAPTLAREVPFGSEQQITSVSQGPTTAILADIDGDGDLDLVFGSYDGDLVAWHPNTGGAFGSRQTISTAANGHIGIVAADIDGDGDLDVVAANIGGGEVAWYPNTDGQGTFGSTQTISSVDYAYSVAVADIDGDGDLDVVIPDPVYDTVYWYENTDGVGGFSSAQVITSDIDTPQAVATGDIDGDGDLDVVSARSGDNTIAWHENMGGGTFAGPHPLTTTVNSYTLAVADIDGDGDLDVAAGDLPGELVLWFENSDGAGSFSTQPAISSLVEEPLSVAAADVDADGDLDVLLADIGDNTVGWFENTDGAGTFGTLEALSTAVGGARVVAPADIDRDGDLDVLWAAEGVDQIAWHENQTIHRSALFPSQEIIAAGVPATPQDASAADLDGDGDLDVLAVSRFATYWFENTDGAGTFGSLQSLGAGTSLESVVGADLDGDGDLDVLNSDVAWFENLDGGGSFGSEQLIQGESSRSTALAADLDGDGDLDVLASHPFGTPKVAWYKNFGADDGSGACGVVTPACFDSQTIISTNLVVPWAVAAADIDGDGDLDVFASGYHAIAWFENTDGDGSFGALMPIFSAGSVSFRSVAAADVDGDGDVDLFSASEADDRVAWYENTDGAGTFGSQQIISSLADGAYAVSAADLDGDGDIDVLSASDNDDKVAWYENVDGLGTFGSEQVVTLDANGAYSMFAADIDGDGAVDAVAALATADNIAWYPNRGGQLALETTDVARKFVVNDEDLDVLKIDVTHRGRAGDSPIELQNFELRLTDGDGTALDQTKAEALIDTIWVLLDEGSGEFEGTETEVASINSFGSITDGVVQIAFTPDDPNVAIAHGTPKSYFVVVGVSSDAASQTPSAFDVTHQTESSSEAQDANAEIPVTLEFFADTGSGKIDTELNSVSCADPGALKIPDDLSMASLNVNAELTCTAGTVLTVGDTVTVVTPGKLTLKAGESVEVEAGLTVTSGGLEIELDD